MVRQLCPASISTKYTCCNAHNSTYCYTLRFCVVCLSVAAAALTANVVALFLGSYESGAGLAVDLWNSSLSRRVLV